MTALLEKELIKTHQHGWKQKMNVLTTLCTLAAGVLITFLLSDFGGHFAETSVYVAIAAATFSICVMDAVSGRRQPSLDSSAAKWLEFVGGWGFFGSLMGVVLSAAGALVYRATIELLDIYISSDYREFIVGLVIVPFCAMPGIICVVNYNRRPAWPVKQSWADVDAYRKDRHEGSVKERFTNATPANYERSQVGAQAEVDASGADLDAYHKERRELGVEERLSNEASDIYEGSHVHSQAAVDESGIYDLDAHLKDRCEESGEEDLSNEGSDNYGVAQVHARVEVEALSKLTDERGELERFFAVLRGSFMLLLIGGVIYALLQH